MEEQIARKYAGLGKACCVSGKTFFLSTRWTRALFECASFVTERAPLWRMRSSRAKTLERGHTFSTRARSDFARVHRLEERADARRITVLEGAHSACTRTPPNREPRPADLTPTMTLERAKTASYAWRGPNAAAQFARHSTGLGHFRIVLLEIWHNHFV